jgi:hypothetical protein
MWGRGDNRNAFGVNDTARAERVLTGIVRKMTSKAKVAWIGRLKLAALRN